MNETNIVIYDILIEVSVLQDRSNKSRTRVEGLDFKTFCPALPASVRGTKIICRGSRQLQPIRKVDFPRDVSRGTPFRIWIMSRSQTPAG